MSLCAIGHARQGRRLRLGRRRASAARGLRQGDLCVARPRKRPDRLMALALRSRKMLAAARRRRPVALPAARPAAATLRSCRSLDDGESRCGHALTRSPWAPGTARSRRPVRCVWLASRWLGSHATSSRRRRRDRRRWRHDRVGQRLDAGGVHGAHVLRRCRKSRSVGSACARCRQAPSSSRARLAMRDDVAGCQ